MNICKVFYLFPPPLCSLTFTYKNYAIAIETIPSYQYFNSLIFY